MIRIDIHTTYRIKFMLSWLYVFITVPIISIILLIFSKWYLCSILLFLSYAILGIITFSIGNIISKKLLYTYIVLYDDYFEIEDKYGNFIKFEKTNIYPSKGGPISVLFDVLSYFLGGANNRNFVDGDFLIEYGIEKINCYISYNSYRILKKLDNKYIYHGL